MNTDLQALVAKHIEGTLEASEKRILAEMLRVPDNQLRLAAILDAQFDGTAVPETGDALTGRQIFSRLLKEIEEQPEFIIPERRARGFQATWLRYAAAILIIAGAGAYFWFRQAPSAPAVATQTSSPVNIPPGGNKAVLTLADGSTIVLDSASEGNLAQQGDIRIIKLGSGQLAYEGASALNSQGRRQAVNATVLPSYNTISTPVGGQYQIVLQDGSKVWLNAASSIRFPTRFIKERVVTVTGEVYFEIAENTQLPFKVKVGGQAEIDVLGTHFNVKAYEGEDRVYTTLLEGAVRINTEKYRQILKPGQQAQIMPEGSVTTVNQADIARVMAWKNGLFNFDGVDLSEVMRQLERWYDIEVVYQKGVPEILFGGKMSRNVPLSDVLTALKEWDVHFKMEGGRKLIVMP